MQVTLVEPNKTFTACPFSNNVIAGLRSIEAQQFGYDKIAASGVTVVAQAATAIDAAARTVGLADGTTLSYDRLVLAPGVDLRWTRCRATTGRGCEDAACVEGRRANAVAAQADSRRWTMAALVVISAPANPLPLPARTLRARVPDRALSEKPKSRNPS